jgi:hypothetical protein
MNDDTNADDRLDLSRLYTSRRVPPDLEDRVVHDLSASGLIRPSGRGWMTWSSRIAAALVLFVAGWAVGQRPTTATPAAEDRFMLLLWEGPDFGAGAPAGSLAAEYGAWAASLAGEGITISGSELGSTRLLLSPTGARTFPEDRLELGGYFILGSESVDDARRLAQDHPHLGYGGWIEIAPLVTR